MATFKIKRGPAIAALAAVAAFFVVIMCCLRRGLEREPVSNFAGIDGGSGEIFFLETNNSLEVFSGRVQGGCAFESAARRNPDNQVIVVMDEKAQMDSLPGHLVKIPNLALLKADFGRLAKGTIVENLWRSGEPSKGWTLTNLSDIVRLLLLHTYGGSYLDTDIISRKKLPADKGDNFAVWDSPGDVNNAIFHFRLPGHRFLEMALEDLARNFDALAWNSSGSNAMGRVLDRFCPGWRESFGKEPIRCPDDLLILPSWHAYPIPWWEWRDYYNTSKLDYVMDRVKGGFGVHYWNHRYTVEGNLSIPMESDHPLYSVMAENCPSTEQRVLRRRLGEPY